jgi:plasmid maintenance system antidote protein VapI
MKRRYRSLQDWMERTGTNQTKLAKLAGLKTPHLSKILSRSRRCSLDKALRLSRVTGVPVETLVEWGKLPEKQGSEQPVKAEVETCAE